MRSRLVALVVFVVACLMTAGAWAEPSLPWARGDAVGEWKIAEIVRHEEFIRLKLENAEGQRVGAEIVAAEPGDPWSTRAYRVQPRPDMPVSAPVLRALMKDLARWEKRPGHESFVAVKRITRVERSVRVMRLRAWSYGLHAALGLLVPWLAVVWWRRQPSIRPWLLGTLAFGVVVGSGWLQLVRPGDLPTSWLTPLHEGFQKTSVQQLYATGDHAGPNFGVVIAMFSTSLHDSIREVVRMNLLLLLVNALLLVLIARHVTGHWLGGIVSALVYALNLNTLNAACSEMPSLLLTTYLFLGVIAAGTLDLEAGRNWRASWAAWLVLGVLTALAALTRRETAVIGAMAVVFGLARLALGERRLERLREWFVGLWPRARAWSRLAQVLAILAIFAVLYVVHLALGTVRGGALAWVAAAADPTAPRVVPTLGMLGVALPFAVVLLALLGVVRGVSRPVVFVGAPFACVGLLRLYLAASHSVVYEQYRYMTFLLPLCVLFAAMGYPVLTGLLKRWPRWRVPAIAALVALVFVPRVAGAIPLWKEDSPLPTPSQPLLSRDRQIEARYLVQQVEKHPSCVFLSRVLHIDSLRGGRRYQFAIFGEPLAYARFVDADKTDWHTLLDSWEREAECVMLYRGLDCNRDRVDCGDEVRGLQRVDELRFQSKPYSWPAEWIPIQSDVVLDVYTPGRGRSQRRGRR